MAVKNCLLFTLTICSIVLYEQTEAQVYFNGRYLKVGLTSFNVTPNYSNFNFRFSDPASGKSVDRHFSGLNLPIHGLDLGMGITSNKNFQLNLFEFEFGSFSKIPHEYTYSPTFFFFGTGVNYFFDLNKQKKIKFRITTGINLAYMNFISTIGELNSSKKIIINGDSTSNYIDFRIEQNVLKLMPEIGFSLFCSKSLEIRFSLCYNISLFQNEILTYKGSSPKFFGRMTKTDYLFDSSNNPIEKNIYSMSPFIFKISLLYNGRK